MSETTPERLCVLTRPYLHQWQIASLERVTETTEVEITLAIVEASVSNEEDDDVTNPLETTVGSAAVRRFLTQWRKRHAWAFVQAERKLSERFSRDDDLARSVPIEEVDCLADVPAREVAPIRDGHWNELPEETVTEIVDQCDVVVRYGFGLLRGDVLTAPEYGVLSFHPADIQRYRGMGPPKVFYDGRDVIGVTLQRLNDEIDAGEIVAYAEADITDCRTLWDVWERVHELQVELLAEGIRALQNPAVEPTLTETLGPYHSPKEKHRASFAGRILLKNLRGHVLRALK